jgi:hypothetical protein
VKGIEGGGLLLGEETVITGISCQRRETGLTGGSGLSAGRGRESVPVWGRLPVPVERTRGLFLFFSFLFLFLFRFLYFFISFSNLIQIDSNQLCKVSKIQNNNPEQ